MKIDLSVPNEWKTALPAVRVVLILDMEAGQHLAPGLAPGPSSGHQQGQGGAVGGQQHIFLGYIHNIINTSLRQLFLTDVDDKSITFLNKSSPNFSLAVETATDNRTNVRVTVLLN